MAKPDLLDSSDSEDDRDVAQDKASHGLVINKRYAKDFTLRKQQEDLRQHAAVLDDDDDSSSSSDEDEEGALLTTKLDTNILKTIHALRSKDARIYDPKVRFFEDKDNEEEDNDGKEEKKKKHKPKRYKDVIREQALEQIEKGSDGDDDGDDDDNDRLGGGKSHRLAYDKEQEDIRKNFLQSTEGFGDTSSNDDDNDDDSDGDGLLVVKKKDPKQIEQEEQEFAQEIQRIESTLKKGKNDKEYVDPKGEVDDGSKFLLNYFKNRSWIDKDKLGDDDDSSDDDDERAASSNWQTRLAKQDADEVVPMKTGDKDDGNESDASLNQLDKTDDFEAQYNFRFEEAAGTQSGADFSLISYARGQTVNTLRRKDETRREKRLARKERKAAERKAKEEELKRLKNLKRKEMERKLHEVKKVVGLAEEDADVDEAAILKLIEGDYDPEEFEKKMQETFGDDFYAKEDKEWKSDKDVRATLMKDEDGNLLVGDDNEGDMYDTVGDEAEEEEDGGNEGNEEEYWDEEEYYEGDQDEEEGEQETNLEKKIKAKMEDELYKLDYEDIVAGMPTRFKYRQVEPNAYGLSTEEILFARDTTLKQFVSLKKMAPYREDGEFTVGGKRRRKFRQQLKQEIEEELGASEEKNDGGKGAEEAAAKSEEQEASSKKRKRRKSKKNKSGEKDDSNKDGDEKPSAEETSKPLAADENQEDNGEDDPDKSNSEPKRKRRRRQKKKKSASTDGDGDAGSPDVAEAKQEAPKPANVEKEKSGKETETITSANKEPKQNDPPTHNDKDIPVKPKKKDKKHKKEEKDRKREKKKGKKSKIDGISQSRLSSYGL